MILQGLIACGKIGYQTVFDEDGINVYYRWCVDTEHIYSGDSPFDALAEIQKHKEELDNEG